jgi:hypothetical protein
MRDIGKPFDGENIINLGVSHQVENMGGVGFVSELACLLPTTRILYTGSAAGPRQSGFDAKGDQCYRCQVNLTV